MKKYLMIMPFVTIYLWFNFSSGKTPELISGGNLSVYYPVAKKKECSFCHNNILDHKVVHKPVFGKCEECHIATGKKHPRALFKGFNLADKSPALCYQCHDANDKKTVHKPVEKGKCNACHETHGSKYEKLLKTATFSELCAKCHDFNITDKKYMHTVIKREGCQACHDPHQSDYASLLKVEETKLCESCHEKITDQKQAKYIHEPFAKKCSGCHDPHSSNENFLLLGKSPGLCFSCHKKLEKRLETEPLKHRVSDSKFSCERCHSPHASEFEHLLVEEGNTLCFGCHNKEITIGNRIISNMEQKIKNAKFVHKPITEKGCISCHDPHASKNDDLLTNSFPKGLYAEGKIATFKLCFKCHPKGLLENEKTDTITNFRNGDVNLHFVHVNKAKGRNCSICHDVHSSDNKLLINNKVQFGKWDMPMRFSKTENGATCRTGCHELKEYKRANIIK